MKRAELYYYADGERVDLTPCDDVVAIRKDRLTESGGVDKQTRNALESLLRPLTRGWSLAETAGLSAASRTALENDGSLQRVFESTGAQLVALPEVRIEETRPQQQRKLKAWLDSLADADVESMDGEITVVRPRSGKGEDAIRLAGRVFEEIHPEAVSPRFIRIVPRPRVIQKPATRKDARN